MTMHEDGDQLRIRVERSIRKILIDDLGVEAAIVETSAADTPLLGRGVGLDSLEALALATGLEEAFDISIDDEELTAELFVSIAALTDFVSAKVTAKP